MVFSISNPVRTFFELVQACTSEKGRKLRGETVDEVVGKRCRVWGGGVDVDVMCDRGIKVTHLVRTLV
jgi:hypothetical protein